MWTEPPECIHVGSVQGSAWRGELNFGQVHELQILLTNGQNRTSAALTCQVLQFIQIAACTNNSTAHKCLVVQLVEEIISNMDCICHAQP